MSKLRAAQRIEKDPAKRQELAILISDLAKEANRLLKDVAQSEGK